MADTFLTRNCLHEEKKGLLLLDCPSGLWWARMEMVSALKQIKVNAPMGKGKDTGIRFALLYLNRQSHKIIQLF